jgi:hypothetical protein
VSVAAAEPGSAAADAPVVSLVWAESAARASSSSALAARAVKAELKRRRRGVDVMVPAGWWPTVTVDAWCFGVPVVDNVAEISRQCVQCVNARPHSPI